MSAALLVLQLCGTVDRIEGSLAVVEWELGELSDVPLQHLPPRIGEGDPVCLHLRASRRGRHRLAPRGEVVGPACRWQLPGGLAGHAHPFTSERALRLRSSTPTRALRARLRAHGSTTP